MIPLSLLAIVLPLGAGDLHLPKNVTKDTPCLLLTLSTLFCPLYWPNYTTNQSQESTCLTMLRN